MGVVSLGIGLWLYTTWNEFATFSDGGRLYGSVFLLATGVGVVVVGYMGIVAALRESRIIATMVRETDITLLWELVNQHLVPLGTTLNHTLIKAAKALD